MHSPRVLVRQRRDHMAPLLRSLQHMGKFEQLIVGEDYNPFIEYGIQVHNEEVLRNKQKKKEPEKAQSLLIPEPPKMEVKTKRFMRCAEKSSFD